MKLIRIHYAAIAALALAAFGAAGSAHARDVTWSVGIQAAPGITVGVGNARPYYGGTYYAPAYYAAPPVYVEPAPVYVAPAPVYYAPRYYARPAPVYYYGPARGYRHNHRW